MPPVKKVTVYSNSSVFYSFLFCTTYLSKIRDEGCCLGNIFRMPICNVHVSPFSLFNFWVFCRWGRWGDSCKNSNFSLLTFSGALPCAPYKMSILPQPPNTQIHLFLLYFFSLAVITIQQTTCVHSIYTFPFLIWLMIRLTQWNVSCMRTGVFSVSFQCFLSST